jgi:RNA polymerase primary sigma factor
MQAIADHSRVVRLPINRITSVNKIGRTASALEQEFERSPTTDEIAMILEISSQEVAQAMQYPGRHVSLDYTRSDKDDQSLYKDIPQESTYPPDHPLNEESMRIEILQALDSLSTKEAEVLQLYFGINTDRAYTLDEIGRMYRLTRERVRQIKEKALFRLRHQSRSKSLRQYLG